MANASRKGSMGAGTVVGHPNVGTTDPTILDEDDLANHMKGNNQLQGNDQERVRNQRLTMPGSQDIRNQPEALGEPGDPGSPANADSAEDGGSIRLKGAPAPRAKSG